MDVPPISRNRRSAGVAGPQADRLRLDSAPDGRPPTRVSPTRAPVSQAFAPAIPALLALASVAVLSGLALQSRGAVVAGTVVAVASLMVVAMIWTVMASLSRGSLRRMTRGSDRRIRVALVGGASAVTALRSELNATGLKRFDVVGWIEPPRASPDESDTTGLRIGSLAELGGVVETHEIDLLVLACGVPRALVVEEVLRSCDGRPVRLYDLSAFYEEVFGHVAVTEIDSAWFAYFLHPQFHSNRRAQRALDLIVGGALVALCMPLLAFLALLIRRDGGPALFRQVRVGEGGRTFTLLKLRTMRAGDPEPERWSDGEDERVTRLGRFLRRTHLDELPQLYNVLCGEMSLVGPRPEQPQIAARLEGSVPFWRCRYRHKPGLTGWAQIRCGYGGSEGGSVWKLAHDLYYLRHRSVALDVAILVATARAMFVPSQYLEPPETAFVARMLGNTGELESSVNVSVSASGQ